MLASECPSPLACMQGYCVSMCKESRDCPSSERCVVTGEGNSCQPFEKATCLYNSDCTTPLVCSFDRQCRNQCKGDVDCAHGQRCTASTHLCADPALDPTYDPAKNEFRDASDAGAADTGDAGPSSDGGADGASDGAPVGASDGSTDLPVDAPAADAAAEHPSGALDGGTVVFDPCVPVDGGFAPEPTPPGAASLNDDRDHSTSLPVETSYSACLQTGADVDFYDVAVPAGGQGGFVVVSLTNVSAQIWATISSAATNATVLDFANPNPGANAYAWFAVAAGAEFRVAVFGAFKDSRSIGAYTITARYVQALEPNEPNEDRAHATPLALGTPVQGLFFLGLEDDTVLTDPSDWFKVTLPAGAMTASLTNVAANLRGQLRLFDAGGAQLAEAIANTFGADVTLTQTIATAGTYYVRVNQGFGDLNANATKGANSRTLPPSATQPYSLTVTAQ
ncbi:MAG TPA: PPC domain-containing protein [Polyangia bacterium]|nr:PPC domain-containing protein [Polyangia bacterium]